MSYYYSKVLTNKSFDEAIEIVTAELKKEGFGVLTEIDVSGTLKNKIDVDFKKYKILGACNPHFAFKALQAEDKVGVFLPCNVVVEVAVLPGFPNGLSELNCIGTAHLLLQSLLAGQISFAIFFRNTRHVVK